MTVIFCDDVYCKIEIVPNMVMAGTFWVVLDGDAKMLAGNEDVKEFYLGISGEGKKSYRDVKHYRRRKRWLA